ncbi:MAG: ABC transporter ATP-binding protein [Clostridia bacterium]|nr:ABC transporter ATP-binding protein [Clostridia bacterium]
MAVIEIKDVHYEYKLPSGSCYALRGVSAAFEVGKLYAITGRSGSGKTTLLSLIAGFDKPKNGTIEYNGEVINEKKIADFRKNRMGIIFQSYNLIPHLTAIENVKLSMSIRGDSKNKDARAREALSAVGLEEKLFKKFPATLSGGEQQRVAIARAMVSSPKLILADEPTGNLDNENSEIIIKLLKQAAHESGACVIVVTHSEEIAAEADHALKMSDGRFI